MKEHTLAMDKVAASEPKNILYTMKTISFNRCIRC